ncbi:response regulator [Vibrio atypicus]|uniref:response regulator n=1 Tax=Vibrio atypicus TaxID=558271 RepID=UPI003735B7D4
MIKVSLIDDHEVVRSGFKQLLSLEEDIEVVGEYCSYSEAYDDLKIKKSEICILDISMPEKSGLDLLKKIAHDVDCIMLSVHDSVTMIEKSLDSGAKGFLSKRCSPDELVLAVRTVAKGGKYLPPNLSRKLVNNTKTDCFKMLTKRELQVGEMLTRGLEIKEIAINLKLSPKTVHIHRANAMDKLNVNNNVELAKIFELEWI